MTQKTEMLWNISKEQEALFLKALPEVVGGIEVRDLMRMIRASEYRRGKEDTSIVDNAKKEAQAEELKFLEAWNADDLIKQAEVEQSHFYVASRAKLIKERIEYLKEQLEINPLTTKGFREAIKKADMLNTEF